MDSVVYFGWLLYEEMKGIYMQFKYQYSKGNKAIRG